VKLRSLTVRVCLITTGAVAASFTHSALAAPLAAAAASTGRHEIYTLPLADGFVPRSATYTPSGRVLVSSTQEGAQDQRHVTLVVMDDDGRNARTIFSQAVPPRPKDNGIRYMMFPDNKRIFMGDFVLECAPSLDDCAKSALLPVTYPAEVADGEHIGHRWSEMIVAPDNRHIAWTTLLATYSALVFTGELRKEGAGYVIADPQIVSTLDPFEKDPKHPDGVIPQVVRGGEVKQFVHGGTAISLAGGRKSDLADSVVHHLATGEMEAITNTAGYDETTIFSPDERLGMVMTTRFSPNTDLAILGMMPRPYSDSLNMGLNMVAYTYGVTGVRASRSGNVGPALTEIAASKSQEGYLGTNLNTADQWVFRSPMSWHPSSTKAMWVEGMRGGGPRRVQIVRLLDYQPGPAVAAKPTPTHMPYAITDMSVVKTYAAKSQDIDVKVYGRSSGHITYRRTPRGAIEKTYVNFSDDGKSVYSGSETMQSNPRGRSTYTADVMLSGDKPGVMKLKMTFGPIEGERPAELIYAPDATGAPLSQGYAEYDGKRLEVQSLVP
jgi:hypothetical protein